MSVPAQRRSPREREELLSGAARAPDAARLFAFAAERMRRLVPYDAAVWRVTDPVNGMMTAPVHAENIDGAECAAYWECELLAEKVNLFRDLARAPLPVAGLWESSEGRPTRSALYHDFMRPRGVHDELRAVLRVGDRTHGYISLFRERGRDPFTSADSRFVGTLVTPLARLLRSFNVPLGAPPGARGGQPGLLLFDTGGSLVSVNEAALGHLHELPDGPTTPTGLGYRIPVWIHSTAMKARALARDGERGDARVRLRTRAGQWLVCHASCLRSADGTLQSFAVVIEPAGLGEIIPLIAGAYEMSGRELEVTVHVARGMSTERIAQELYLSPHTVRDHIKAAFEKVGVTSRGELVGKLFIEHYAPLAEAEGGGREL
ncbi:helix-turn-helix transcriptional regulator [Streptomyces sp. NBC_01795]|uniref:response regulator transcription factor n=1 Tax=unclassified Streptomyces TaxID=2593676 RepID=UPI002DDAF252|nr:MULTISPECIES: helix-turn-helix transcriptional regulator [unclassified Streptomyces]WSA91206.1 helix-turn-helix transcriptional regulator [Streptomyces sp. NBC_01795]WSB75531.1 helix-turn-helix transcriptional regulator [Streptomyces sp. NBC_01775]